MQLASRFASRSPALRSDYPLTDDQIRRVAPSIFADAPHESRSERYAYIPTATVLQELRGEGFEPFMVCQTRVRHDDRRDYTKHMIRLRHASPSQYRLDGDDLVSRVDGVTRRSAALRRGRQLFLEWEGELLAIEAVDPIAEAEAAHAHQGGLSAPMNGSIVRVLVEPGQTVEAGATLVVLEAMKMEHSIRAPHAGVVKALYCSEGELVEEGTPLVELDENQA